MATKIATQCLNCSHLAIDDTGLFRCPKCGSFELHHFEAFQADEQPDVLDAAGLQRLLAETLADTIDTDDDGTDQERPAGQLVQFRKGN